MQDDPVKPTLKAPGIKLLNLEYDKPLSKSAFKFNLRRYTAGSVAHVFPDTPHARAAAYADRPCISYFTVDQAGVFIFRASPRPMLKRRTDSARLHEHSP